MSTFHFGVPRLARVLGCEESEVRVVELPAALPLRFAGMEVLA